MEEKKKKTEQEKIRLTWATIEREKRRVMKEKKYKLHAIPTVRAEAEPLVRLTTGGRVTLLPEADLGIPCIMRRGFIRNAAGG